MDKASKHAQAGTDSLNTMKKRYAARAAAYLSLGAALTAVYSFSGRGLSAAAVPFAAAALSLYGQPCPPQRRELAAQVTENLTKAQIMRTIELFQSYRRECDWNVGPGHVLGALAAELEGIL